MPKPDMKEIGEILESVRALAIRYYEQTGKPLGVTGEMAEFEASRILGLELCVARQDGYDAVRSKAAGPQRIQIKGRRIMDVSKPGQRLGGIKLQKDWDSVMLVLLDDQYRATAIHEAERAAVKAALEAPGSKARNERGALAVSKFKAIGRLLWQREPNVAAKAAAKKSGAHPGGATLRSAGLAFLDQKLSDSPGLQTALGFKDLGSKGVKTCISVSKLYPPKNSWTGEYCWWFTIPVEKTDADGLDKLVFLCSRTDGKGFHVLAVPKAWIIAHRSQLAIAKGRWNLFMEAVGKDLFVDKRGNGNLNFSQWVQG